MDYKPARKTADVDLSVVTVNKGEFTAVFANGSQIEVCNDGANVYVYLDLDDVVVRDWKDYQQPQTQEAE